MNATFMRASHAVEDALASDNNHPDDIARAVRMAVREQWLEIYHASEGKPLPTYEQAEGFPDMIDAILNEKDTTND